jgi:hypothetical protein
MKGLVKNLETGMAYRQAGLAMAGRGAAFPRMVAAIPNLPD